MPLGFIGELITIQPVVLIYEPWDVRYRIKVYSDILYNVRLHPLYSAIGVSNIRLSQIVLINDIRVNTHLWLFCIFLLRHSDSVTIFYCDTSTM